VRAVLRDQQRFGEGGERILIEIFSSFMSAAQSERHPLEMTSPGWLPAHSDMED